MNKSKLKLYSFPEAEVVEEIKARRVLCGSINPMGIDQDAGESFGN